MPHGGRKEVEKAIDDLEQDEWLHQTNVLVLKNAKLDPEPTTKGINYIEEYQRHDEVDCEIY